MALNYKNNLENARKNEIEIRKAEKGDFFNKQRE